MLCISYTSSRIEFRPLSMVLTTQKKINLWKTNIAIALIRMRELRFRGAWNCSYFYRPLGCCDRCARGENNLGLSSIIFSSVATSTGACSCARLHSHAKTHHTLWDSSGRVISREQRPLADNINALQEIDIRARRQESNPQSRQASGRIFTPQSERPLGWAKQFYISCKWQCIYVGSSEPPDSKPKILL